MIGSYGVVLCCYEEKISFSLKVHVFSREMLLIIRLKRPQTCFSFYFRFLIIVVLLVLVFSVLFLVAVISLSQCFSM